MEPGSLPLCKSAAALRLRKGFRLATSAWSDPSGKEFGTESCAFWIEAASFLSLKCSDLAVGEGVIHGRRVNYRLYLGGEAHSARYCITWQVVTVDVRLNCLVPAGVWRRSLEFDPSLG